VGGSSRSPHYCFYLTSESIQILVHLTGVEALDPALCFCGDAAAQRCGERANEVTDASDRLCWWKIHTDDHLCHGMPPWREES